MKINIIDPHKFEDYRDYSEQSYTNKLNSLEEINKFLEMYNISRLNHKEIENLKVQLLIRRLSQ